MTRLPLRLLAATALLSLPVAASAHRQWLVPSATVFSGTDSYVTVDAASSNDLFFADHRPSSLNAIKVWAPDGSEGKIENGASGAVRSTFDVKLDKPGTWKIGTLNSMVTGSFKLNGEERRVGGRMGGGAGGPGGGTRTPPVAVADIPAEATDIKLTEIISRNEIYITADASSATVFKPSGKGLEFEPVTHPDALVAGETASFRFLIDGKPASGLKVTVVPGGKRYRNDDGARDFTTGADGIARIDWPAAGLYWINATATDNKPSEPKASQRRMGYTTTVEVLLP
ncbi:DUF4198 domain-containing protein [Rhizorhabdus dicambivorans]|uniref:DUF4198 domain-containing protein n=1 Tax=Rhizorhabdus dicambivorans TaxID=1850238 RepID=A0A2A4FV89_9SPHN|nr:DUF4198 domain-containing protein [Rhizorhabdus dicambivorans]ATE65313.1 DUF4198 domain-containing protein [Rhizorhabdus dicambivorans]PCE42360.1 DUF4198 domain-containing protein [Rhizorhabdus dicambivorans]